MGQEYIGLVQHCDLVHRIFYGDIVGDSAQVLDSDGISNGQDDLIFCIGKGQNAFPVKPQRVIYDGSHGNVDQLFPCLDHLLRDRSDGGTDKIVPVGKCFRTRLERGGSIYDRVGLVVILQNVQDIPDGIALVLQSFEILIDPGH